MVISDRRNHYNALYFMQQLSLIEKLNYCGVRVTQEQAKKLERYLALLVHWNKHINLTAINTESEVYTHHLLDSLSALEYIQGSRILDLGTGGGLPGVPLAVMRPQSQLTLLDARNKKISFLLYIKAQLQLENIYPVNMRAQEYQPEHLFDCIVCRAFASLDKIYLLGRSLLKEKGCIVSMKGRYPEQELATLDDMKLNYQVKSVDVPGLDAQRHIVKINLMDDTIR